MAGDRKGEIDNHNIAVNQGDLPKGVVEKAEGGMKDRGGQAGPNIAGSGTHGMQDDVNRPQAPGVRPQEKPNLGDAGQDVERRDQEKTQK